LISQIERRWQPRPDRAQETQDVADSTLGTPEQLRDPDYTPPLHKAIPLGIQHVLAMFVANVTPAIIVAGAAGFGFGSNSPDFPNLIYMLQMSMFFAGAATLLQTISFGPVGARLPIVQGTSFAFIPIMIPLVAGKGVDAMAAVMGGVLIGGLFHAALGTVIGRIRFALPPLVTGLVVTMIGLALVKVGIQYAAGGVPAIGTEKFGNLQSWSIALVVIFVTLGLKFFARGMLSVSAVLLGLLAGYAAAWSLGMVNFGGIARAALFAVPNPLHFGLEFTVAAVIGFCAMAFVSAVETVGDVSGITKGGAGREASEREIRGATFADGLGTAVSGLFGALPNTSFSQNVGLIAMTGVMSRHVVTFGACVLILAGLFPKVGAVISTIPIEVLGGGVIVMFGMVVAAGISMLSDVHWNRRNMVIFAIALSIGLGLQLEPSALQHLSDTPRVLLTSGILPAAAIAIILNLVLPQTLAAEATEEVSGGMKGEGAGLDPSDRG
jgi:xanthine permease